MDKLVSIDGRLLDDALLMSGLENVDEVVQLSLTMFINVRLHKQELIRKYRGALKWDADAVPESELTEEIRVVN